MCPTEYLFEGFLDCGEEEFLADFRGRKRRFTQNSKENNCNSIEPGNR
jgi:hypothetical protein